MGTQRLIPRTAIDVTEAVRRDALPLTGDPHDYDALLDLVGDARVVLLGEASHGTHEFYRERARITKRLIQERGFTAVAIEGDWPDAYRVNRFVSRFGARRATRRRRCAGSGASRHGCGATPTSWTSSAGCAPTTTACRAPRGSGFYGLDLYSLGASMEAVIGYLDRHDPEAAERARRRYECLQPYSGESTEYGRAVLLGVSASCRRQVLEQLVDLRRRGADYLRRDGTVAEDEYFFAEQNAVLVGDAEEYYRTMLGDAAASWNLRDRHMADTLDHLMAHLDRHDGAGRVVVWEHNSHIGDARATEMGAARASSTSAS